MVKKLLILIGLPASGKSTFAKEYKHQIEMNNDYLQWNEKKTVEIIDCDEIMEDDLNKNYLLDKIVEQTDVFDSNEAIIVDGLFLTNEHIIDYLNKLQCDHSLAEIDSIELHYWIPNIDKCLWNDKHRRIKDAKITIKNAIIEEPNLILIKEKIKGINIKLIKHEIDKKPSWKVFADKYNISLTNGSKMGSKEDSWCLGGNWVNYLGNSGYVEAESQPTNFEDFNKLIEKINPNINFLHYNKLYNKSVNVETYGEDDYYGGHTEHAYFICNVDKLYFELIELGIIKESDL